MKMLIRSAGMVQDGQIAKCDLLIRNGQIEDILPAGSDKAADEEIDAEGLYLSMV